MSFCCPRCQATLAEQPLARFCVNCDRAYPVRFGLIDFRAGRAVDVDATEDLQLAEVLAEREPHLSFIELRRCYYSLRPESSEALHERHEAHFRAEASRAAAVVERLAAGPLLDLGCGAGQYLLAATRRGRRAVGVDASLCQLILARRLLADEGRTAELAAADVESLPLADEAFSAVIATDVLEHVRETSLLLSEAARVTAPGGMFWLTTPNRFSLTPEPHVGLFAVGWLPHSLAVPYVRARTGVDYRSIRLLSATTLRAALQREFGGDVDVQPPNISAAEMSDFPPFKRRFASMYNGLFRSAALRPLLLGFAPYVEALCRKDDRSADARISA